MNATVVPTAIRRFAVLAGALALGLAGSSCSGGASPGRPATANQQQSNSASASSQAKPDLELPGKTFRGTQGDLIRVDGHWVLKTSDPPLESAELPFAAQPLNSTVIECSRSTRTCQEYRATVVGRLLLPNDPITFEVTTWDSERIVASWTGPAAVECSVRIDWLSKEVDMEFRRQPTTGRRRVFERWVLE